MSCGEVRSDVSSLQRKLTLPRFRWPSLLACVAAALTTPAELLCQTELSMSAPTVAAKEILSIAPGPKETWLFGRVRDIISDRFGKVYALDESDQKIRVFDARGKSLAVLGGVGRGPGEFTRARWMQIVKDTLWVADFANARLTAYQLPGGALLTTRRVSTFDQSIVGVSTRGVFIAKSAEGNNGDRFRPSTMRILHQQAGAEGAAEIGSYTVSRPSLAFRVYTGERKQPLGAVSVPQPFDNGWLYKVSPDGESVVLIDRASAPTTGDSRFAGIRIMEVSSAGKTLSTHTFKVAAPALSRTDVAKVADSLATMSAEMMSSKPAGIPAEIADSLYKPSRWPPTLQFHVGLDRSIWLQQPLAPGPEARYWRISASGEVLPAVSVPSSFKVFRVTRDRMYGIGEDDSGANVVKVMEVPKGVR